MKKEDRRLLPDLLFSIVEKPTSTTLASSGSLRDWPKGRGVYYSKDERLFAWVNREDHIRIMLRDRNPDFKIGFQRFVPVHCTMDLCIVRK